MPNSKKSVVLLAEDNEHDVIAMRRAWQKLEIDHPLCVVHDGAECLDYLYRQGKYQDPAVSPRPRLLLLDINMPRIDGLSVLRRIRNDAILRRLPVVMLTTSKMEEDRVRSYDLGANAFITKPDGFSNFTEAVKRIDQFWEIVEQPEWVDGID